MSAEFHDQYVQALIVVRDRYWVPLFAGYRKLENRYRDRAEYVEAEWTDLQRDIFDAIALAMLEIQGVAIDGSEPPAMVTALTRPVTDTQAQWLARERYWAGSHGRFHALWSRDVGQDGYAKADWRDFNDAVVAAIATAIVDASR